MFKDTFDELIFSRISDPQKLYLKQDLLWNDTVDDKDKEILLDINPNLHESLIPDDVLYSPTGNEPGVLFINGERIEYWEVEKLTDGNTGLPYFRIPYKEITYTDPAVVKKIPKFLRRTKGTSIGAPEYLNGSLNTELKIPEGTLVVPSGPKQFFSIPFNRASGTIKSLQVEYTVSVIVGTGTQTTYTAPVIPTRTTITSAWLVTGPNPEDREIITEYTLTDDEIIFDTAPSNGTEIELVAANTDSFNLNYVNNPQTLFLRSTYGSYESKINN
jgi:hypothetical protein